MPVSIDQSGQEPSKDGAITLFTSPELVGKTWFNRGQRAIFVNGMDNSGKDHAESARALSLMLACSVTGVFNKTDGKWIDLGQCIKDKAAFDFTAGLGRPMLGFNDWNLVVDLGYSVVKRKQPGTSRAAYVRTLIQSNPATVALYDLLQESGYSTKSVPIFAHSQGNLITSNALTALALAKGKEAIRGRVVYSYGSPCRYWPEGLTRTNNLFTLDLVGFLDLRFDWSSSKVGFVPAHSFLTYMQHDPEFIINRFRMGGYGMTFNMNEKGLADALAGMGRNVERIHKVFLRLDDKHNADADDVACYYLEKFQTPAGQATLKSMAKAKPDLIKLLIKILDEGVTTSQEQKLIGQLQKALH